MAHIIIIKWAILIINPQIAPLATLTLIIPNYLSVINKDHIFLIVVVF